MEIRFPLFSYARAIFRSAQWDLRRPILLGNLVRTLFDDVSASSSFKDVWVIGWILMGFVSIKSAVYAMFTLTEKQQKQINSFMSFYSNSSNDSVTANLVERFKQNYPIQLWEYYGLFRDDFILKINVHWLQFPPPSEQTHYFLAALYIIIMTLGMFGNALVIFMIGR